MTDLLNKSNKTIDDINTLLTLMNVDGSKYPTHYLEKIWFVLYDDQTPDMEVDLGLPYEKFMDCFMEYQRLIGERAYIEAAMMLIPDDVETNIHSTDGLHTVVIVAENDAFTAVGNNSVLWLAIAHAVLTYYLVVFTEAKSNIAKSDD